MTLSRRELFGLLLGAVIGPRCYAGIDLSQRTDAMTRILSRGRFIDFTRGSGVRLHGKYRVVRYTGCPNAWEIYDGGSC